MVQVKAGDQIITFRQDLARHCETGIVHSIRPGVRGQVVDMAPPLYHGSARVKFDGESGEFYVLYEAIMLAPGYRSGDAIRGDS